MTLNDAIRLGIKRGKLVNRRDEVPVRYRRLKTYRERMRANQNEALQRRAARRRQADTALDNFLDRIGI